MSSISHNRAAPRKGQRRGEQRRVSLAETLDRVLNKGAVVVGDIVLSVAGIELVYVGVNLVLCSVETMRGVHRENAAAAAAAAMGASHAPR